MNLVQELEKLQQLYATGAISQAEFLQAKAQLLNSQPNSQPMSGNPYQAQFTPEQSQAYLESQTRQWAMLLHLSSLTSMILPVLGLIAPIVIWQVKKAELPGIDEHGKMATNWIISWCIYSMVSIVLCFVLIGIPMLIGLAICGLVFPILAGLKANQGILWQYPLTIKFIS